MHGRLGDAIDDFDATTTGVIVYLARTKRPCSSFRDHGLGTVAGTIAVCRELHQAVPNAFR